MYVTVIKQVLYLGFATGRVKIPFPTSDVSAVRGIADPLNRRTRWLLNKETARAVKTRRSRLTLQATC